MLKREIGFQDVSSVEWDSDRAGEVLTAMDTGDVVQIHPSVFDYFLEVMPPRYMGRGMFVFCEGEDFPTLFCALYGEHYCLRATTDQSPRQGNCDWKVYTADLTESWTKEFRSFMREQIERSHSRKAGV